MLEFNYTLIIQFFNLLIVLILLNVFLFKPVLNAISKRENTIGSMFGKADGTEEEAKKLARLYEDGSKEKKKPMLESKEATLLAAHNGAIKLIETARTDLADELLKVRTQVDLDSKEAFDSLKGSVDRLSSEVVQKILQRSL